MTIRETLQSRLNALLKTDAALDECKRIVKDATPALTPQQNKALSDILIAVGLTEQPAGGLSQWLNQQSVKQGQKIAKVQALLSNLPTFTPDQEATFFKVVQIVLTGGLR